MANSMLLKWLNLFWLAVLLSTNAFAVSFVDNFDSTGQLSETGEMGGSLDPNWWLNSGGYFYRTGGVAATVEGELAYTDSFRLLYMASNSTDTDNGHYPQNIFRLVTRAKFKNFTQQVFFNIQKINLSASPNRNQSNGVLFFHRYQDGDNLYYVGIRVDGYAIVKKKRHGHYHELKSVAVYPGHYNRETLPNLIPINRWLGLRTVIADNANGNVEITMYLNDDQLGSGWIKILQVEDTGANVERLLNEGHAGIRTDFMDVRFDNYQATESE